MENLLRLGNSHIPSAAETLTKAFWNYPVTTYSYPDETVREQKLPFFFRLTLYYCLKFGEIYSLSSDLEGVAAWLPSDKYPMSIWRLLRSVPFSVFLKLGGDPNHKMQDFSDYIDDVHERLAPFPHFFLQTIGVSPQYHGKGFASKLLRPVLNKLDKELIPCYLETLDEKDVPIYEHFGFKVLEKSSVPGTNLTNWAMLRTSNDQ